MLVCAVVVPATPLLLSEHVGQVDPIPDLRAAVLAAVAKAAAEADEVVLVAGDDGYATSPSHGAPAEPTTTRIGLRLLEEAAVDLPVTVETVAFDATAAEAVALGERLATTDRRTLLLVVGDGSARHDAKAPGALDERAVPFDATVAEILGDGDAASLRGIDPVLADELMVAGRSAWQVLAGALPSADGELHWTGAPYGVGYHVASWRPRD